MTTTTTTTTTPTKGNDHRATRKLRGEGGFADLTGDGMK